MKNSPRVAIRLVAMTVLLAAPCLYGCAASPARPSGTFLVSREVAASRDAVWAAVPGVLGELGLHLHAENAEDGLFAASRPSAAFSTDDNIEIFVASTHDATSTHVEVVARGTNRWPQGEPPWGKEILGRLCHRLLAPCLPSL